MTLHIIKTGDAVVASDCSGTQHEDCVRLLQRLQAAAKLPVLSSKGANSAAAAGITADAEPKIPPDMAEIPSLSVPASECMLDVHNSKAQGRQLAVTNNIAAGTVMWTEQPYVHVLLKRHRKQVCLLVNVKQSDKAVWCVMSSLSVQSACPSACLAHTPLMECLARNLSMLLTCGPHA